MTVSDRIRVKNVRLLSDDHYILKTTTFEWRRANGEWQTQHRETYDRGNAATLLPYIWPAHRHTGPAVPLCRRTSTATTIS
jgi:ribonuclease HI